MSAAVARIPPPPKWAIDMNNPPAAKKGTNSIPDPPGFSATRSSGGKKSQQVARKVPTPEETATLKLKKAWEVALGPAKQLPMQAIMGYMSGNSLQIFSIMMVIQLFKNPIQGVLQTNQIFSKFETEGYRSQMLGVKVVYILMQSLMLALGIYKVNSMGLLPTARSDWLAWEYERTPLERAYFASG